MILAPLSLLVHTLLQGGDFMYTLPHITPLNNLIAATETLQQIGIYQKNNWAIGQLYPAGGPDAFTYFFAIRNIPIFNYLRGTIQLGEPSAYACNREALSEYINTMVCAEVELCNRMISEVKAYQSKNWAIGEAYPCAGPDQFVVFFGQRDLKVEPYLEGCVTIGSSAAYEENIAILTAYKKRISAYYVC